MAIQSFISTVISKKSLTSDVIQLSFSVPEAFLFQAGQFVNLKITSQGVTKPRSYSILSPPSQRRQIELCIKIVPEGFASQAFVQLKPGDQLPVMGPFGHFLFDEQADEHWFICTGTGITPFYSMLKEYLPKCQQKRFHLLFGVRYKKDILFAEEFALWKHSYPWFDYTITLTGESWEGKSGRVQQHLPADLQGKTFYICGLKDLVLETKALLIGFGVSPPRIRFERYT